MSDVTRSGCHICGLPRMPEKWPYTAEEAARFCPGELAHAEARIVALSESLDRARQERNALRAEVERLRERLVRR